MSVTGFYTEDEPKRVDKGKEMITVMFKLPCSSLFSRSQVCLWSADPFSEIPTVLSFLQLI